MSTTTRCAEERTGSGRSIDHERYLRALTEEMTVKTLAPGMMTVEHDGETYTVDLVSGACDCPDHQYRHMLCKHLLRASLVCLYIDDQYNTELVARVAHFAREDGCPDHREWCDGPVGPSLPCADCLNAVRSPAVDEWTVWLKTAGLTGERR